MGEMRVMCTRHTALGSEVSRGVCLLGSLWASPSLQEPCYRGSKLPAPTEPEYGRRVCWVLTRRENEKWNVLFGTFFLCVVDTLLSEF